MEDQFKAAFRVWLAIEHPDYKAENVEALTHYAWAINRHMASELPCNRCRKLQIVYQFIHDLAGNEPCVTLDKVVVDQIGKPIGRGTPH